MHRPLTKTERKYDQAGVDCLEICERRTSVHENRKYPRTQVLFISMSACPLLTYKSRGETHSQKLPPRLMCSQPTSKPPVANPTFVGIKMDPADAGDQPSRAIA